MSKIKLTGESSGYVEISAGNAAGNNTLEAPTSGTRLVAHEGSQDVTLNGNLTVNGVVSYEDVTNIDSVGIMTARAGINVTGGNLTVDAFSNTANNYLSLRSGYVPSASGGMGFMSADHSGSNADGVAIYGHDGISLYTAQTERLRITSAGNMGLGTASPRSITNFGSFAINGTAGAFTDYFLNGTRTGTTAVDSNGFTSEAVGSSTPFRVITNGSERLRVNASGTLIMAAGGDLQMASNGRIFVGNGGNATNPMFANVSDTNTGIAFPAADTMLFTTGGSERLSISSGGVKQVKNGNLNIYQTYIDFSGDQSSTPHTAVALYRPADGTFAISTQNAERLRITSSGDLFVAGTGGMNTTQLPNGSTINVNGTSSNDGLSVIRYSTGYGAYGLNIGRSKSDTIGTNAAVTNGNDLGHISFYGADGTDFNMAAQITAQVDGNPSDGTDMPGRLVFKTSSDGSASPTERLRITSDGALLIGDYGASSGRFVFFNADQSGGADTTYSKDKGLYIRNDCGPTHVDLNGVDNFTAKLHNGAYAGSGISSPQGTITKLLLQGVTHNGYSAYGSICLDVQNANSGRGDLVFLNGGNNTSTTEHLRITSGGTVKINPAELQTTAGDKFAQIRGGGVINTKRLATGHFGNTASYKPQEYGYIGDYMHYGCNAVYFLAQTTTGNSGYSSHMFSWYDSGHWGHYGKFILICQESGYIGGVAHRYLSGTTVQDIFNIGNTGSVSTTSTTTGSGTHSGQSVTRYDCTVSHSGTYRTMRWYLGLFHGAQLGVTGSGKSQSDCNTYANGNGSLLHLFGVSDSNLTMAPNYRTW